MLVKPNLQRRNEMPETKTLFMVMACVKWEKEGTIDAMNLTIPIAQPEYNGIGYAPIFEDRAIAEKHYPNHQIMEIKTQQQPVEGI